MNFRRDREKEEKAPWVPRTEIGRKVQNKEIVSIEEIFEMGKPILEYQIVDALLPNLKEELIQVSTTQRMTDCGRKMKFRAVMIVGDGNGHVGVGFGKADEAKPAIESAIGSAKRNIIRVPLSCGSWECSCNTRHTVPIKVVGKNGSVKIELKPAPRGVGIVANEIARKTLELAGVKDVWSFSRGRTKSVYNMAMAVINALDSLNKMRYTGDWETALGEKKEVKESPA
ncbi:30S ribosomal protein S5 [Candidatus Micrarchaeota archaeon]|nr:30S ribosomal protein S5 [Candidatus Micrarchaeota archaeon]